MVTNQIYIKNNIVYLPKNYRCPEWCDVDESNLRPYFLLNETTKDLFIKEFTNDLLNDELFIQREDIDTIINYTALERRSSPPQLIQPKGITLEDHQRQALAYMLNYKRFAIFLGPGTGKTLIAISWILSMQPNTVLVVTPAKVMAQFRSELNKYIPGNDFIVTDYDQLEKAKPADVIFFDESQNLKNYTAIRTETARRLAAQSKNVYLFSGTPMDKLRHDMLSQLAVLDQRVMPQKSKILTRYFTLNDYYQPAHERRDRQKELKQLIATYSWGRKSEDVIELTPMTEHIVKCTVAPQYYTLKNTRVLKLNETDEEPKYVADTPGKLRIYLKEICAGIDFANDKQEKLTDIFRHLNNGIIYYEFTNSLTPIISALESIGKSYVIVNGMTTPKQTKERIEAFKTAQADVLVIQTASGSAGLDLTNTNTIVYYTLPDSYIKYEQSLARVRRKGQTKPVDYYYLLCENTVEDELLLPNLKKKKTTSDKNFAIYLTRRISK